MQLIAELPLIIKLIAGFFLPLLFMLSRKPNGIELLVFICFSGITAYAAWGDLQDVYRYIFGESSVERTIVPANQDVVPTERSSTPTKSKRNNARKFEELDSKLRDIEAKKAAELARKLRQAQKTARRENARRRSKKVAPIQKPNPRPYNEQSNLLVRAQAALAKKRCYFGSIDGKLGSRTIASIKQFNSVNLSNIDPSNLELQDVLNISSVNMFPCSGTYRAPGSTAAGNEGCILFNGKLDCD